MITLRLLPSLLLLAVAATQQPAQPPAPPAGPATPPAALLPQEPAPAVLVEPVVQNRIGETVLSPRRCYKVIFKDILGYWSIDGVDSCDTSRAFCCRM